MQAQATAKYLRTGDRKVGTVLKLIRGKKVEEALTILRFTERRAAEMVEKALKSAIANGNQGEVKLDMGRARVLSSWPTRAGSCATPSASSPAPWVAPAASARSRRT